MDSRNSFHTPHPSSAPLIEAMKNPKMYSMIFSRIRFTVALIFLQSQLQREHKHSTTENILAGRRGFVNRFYDLFRREIYATSKSRITIKPALADKPKKQVILAISSNILVFLQVF